MRAELLNSVIPLNISITKIEDCLFYLAFQFFNFILRRRCFAELGRKGSMSGLINGRTQCAFLSARRKYPKVRACTAVYYQGLQNLHQF